MARGAAAVVSSRFFRCFFRCFCLSRPVGLFPCSLTMAFGTLRASADWLGDGMQCNGRSEIEIERRECGSREQPQRLG